MPMKLYYNDMSPSVRAVLLTIKALDLEIELNEIQIYTKENINADLKKMNPQQTVPILIDEDLVIWDSHAIVTYLVMKNEKFELYPTEIKIRALIDQNLHFNSGVLYPRVDCLLKSIVVENEKEIATSKISAITEAYKLLDITLQNQNFIAGNTLTIADLCCVATISTATIFTPISAEKYPNLSKWYRYCKNLPYYDEANGVGLNKLDALVEFKLGRPSTKEICE